VLGRREPRKRRNAVSNDDYVRGYADGVAEVRQICEKHIAAKVATIEADAQRRIAEAERRVADIEQQATALDAELKSYAAELEQKLAAAAERYGIDGFEAQPVPMKH
jgi:hypothetical protein